MEKPFVLVADDNAATRSLLVALLRNDFVVETANDGMEAIALLTRRQYAVILLDLLMPDVDGYAVLEFLRENHPDHLRRVMVVTAALAPQELDRVGGYDVFTVVAKPFEIESLLATVKKCSGIAGPGLGAPILSTGMILLVADLLRRV